MMSHHVSAVNLIAFLNVELAPMEVKHGELVEVYGEGVLILGESGVGKSETALELVKEATALSQMTSWKYAVSPTKLLSEWHLRLYHFIEIRGIGILDVKYLYGVGSVKITENINLVINMEIWDPKKAL